MYIMSTIKSCLRLLRMGGAAAERMRQRANAGTRPQPGGNVSMFQDSGPAPGHWRVLAQLQAMNVGPVGGSIPWCIPWCLLVRSGGRRGGAPVRNGALRRAPRRRRGGASAHRFDPPRGSRGRVGPAAARWRAHWPDFNRDSAAEAPVRTHAIRRAAAAVGWSLPRPAGVSTGRISIGTASLRMNVGLVGGSITWCILWCLPSHIAACACCGWVMYVVPMSSIAVESDILLFNFPARDSVVFHNKVHAARPAQILLGVDLGIVVSPAVLGGTAPSRPEVLAHHVLSVPSGSKSQRVESEAHLHSITSPQSVLTCILNSSSTLPY